MPDAQHRRHAGSASPLRWVSRNFRDRGLFGGLGYYAGATVEFLRDLMPERRRSRFGDVGYDFEHGVDTTWATVSLRTRFREVLSGARYHPTEPELFHKMLAALPVPPERFIFIDLGSGKGRTLLMASDYPFRRIIGLELLEELHQIAQQNIARYRGPAQKCFDIESLSGDARDSSLPVEPTVLYLFNPFPEHVMRAVLISLEQSVAAYPREVYIIYHNPAHESVFVEQSWLRELTRTQQFNIYQAGC